MPMNISICFASFFLPYKMRLPIFLCPYLHSLCVSVYVYLLDCFVQAVPRGDIGDSYLHWIVFAVEQGRKSSAILFCTLVIFCLSLFGCVLTFFFVPPIFASYLVKGKRSKICRVPFGWMPHSPPRIFLLYHPNPYNCWGHNSKVHFLLFWSPHILLHCT